jgi:hypothetical protein
LKLQFQKNTISEFLKDSLLSFTKKILIFEKFTFKKNYSFEKKRISSVKHAMGL